MSDETPRNSPLHDKHVALEARFADEGGWRMPLSYGSVVDECRIARQRAGVYDASHYGRFRLKGDGALELLERVCCHDVARQEDDTAWPALLLNERGGILDAVQLLRLENEWLLITSPGNRGKILEHLRGHAAGLGVKIVDQTHNTVQIGVCGPAAGEILDRMLPLRVSDQPPRAVREGNYLVARYTAIRQSVSGLWGLEVVLPAMLGPMAWEFITSLAGADAVSPIGMAALDVLRIESGRLRYGHELNETVDPMTAGVGEWVDGDAGRSFVGSEALRQRRGRPVGRRLVGLVLTEDASAALPPIARQGTVVREGSGQEVGVVTSGTWSPELERSVALAYVSAGQAGEGTELVVEMPGTPLPARVVGLPFA